MKHQLFVAVLLASCGIVSLSAAAPAAEPTEPTRQQDVIYGRKFGTALTMDVITPADQNGIGIILVVSGGWFSNHDRINTRFVSELLDRGYTVFAVVHGSQPKFTIPEILEDMHRAVRFIRHNANQYGIDPDRLGITGASAGGHLSLMQGLAGKEANPNPNPEPGWDPVDQESSRVQAVACFFPPTDFLNYGETGEVALGDGILHDFHAPFDFHVLDPVSRSFVPVTDVTERLKIGKEISPRNHVSSDDCPILIIHGDADPLVPIQQAEILIEDLKEAGVPCELTRKPGAKHGWPTIVEDMSSIADWFDKHLRDQTK